MHTFALLLGVAPQAVMIHPHSVACIDYIHGAAHTIYTLIKDDRCSAGVYKWVAAFHRAVIEEVPPGRKHPKQQYVAPRSPAEVTIKYIHYGFRSIG